MSNIPKPVERQDQYYNYLINGGDINKLPEPIDRIDHYLYYLCVNGFGSGSVTPEMMDEAVENYLSEHPVQAGATEEQAKQIQDNTDAIEKLQDDLGEDMTYEKMLAFLSDSEGGVDDGE